MIGKFVRNMKGEDLRFIADITFLLKTMVIKFSYIFIYLISYLLSYTQTFVLSNNNLESNNT